MPTKKEKMQEEKALQSLKENVVKEAKAKPHSIEYISQKFNVPIKTIRLWCGFKADSSKSKMNDEQVKQLEESILKECQLKKRSLKRKEIMDKAYELFGQKFSNVGTGNWTTRFMNKTSLRQKMIDAAQNEINYNKPRQIQYDSDSEIFALTNQLTMQLRQQNLQKFTHSQIQNQQVSLYSGKQIKFNLIQKPQQLQETVIKKRVKIISPIEEVSVSLPQSAYQEAQTAFEEAQTQLLKAQKKFIEVQNQYLQFFSQELFQLQI